MEYVYMKQPAPTNATGVEVTISVVDPNGNYYNVGTTTSDTSGSFKLAFDPQVPGAYTILASFTGSGSYYGSTAETAIVVDEAATTAPTETPPASMADQYLIPLGIAIIATILIVGVVLVLVILRKRP
jgi:hypothetical protein